MSSTKLRVGILGAGYWGPNLIRTFRELPGCEVAYVCDQRPGRLQYVRERFPEIAVTAEYANLLTDSTLAAVVVATPVSTHRALARQAIDAGKHVFVEKPLAGTSADALALVEAAAAAGVVLATGHIFVYHPAITVLREHLRRGDLGTLCYAESSRVNLGPPSSEVDVIWDLAVHDVSILLSLLDAEPIEVATEGRRYVHPFLTDVAFINLRFADGFMAQHHVSWLSPVKVRRFFVAGRNGSATFDDTRDTGKLWLSDQGEDSRIGARDTDVKDLFYRPGEIHLPEIPPILPLTAECAHFLDCILRGGTPQADGRSGLAVVRVLEAARESVRTGGRPVALAPTVAAAPAEVGG